MIRELKTFMVISANGTFSAAGDKLGLTQAAVSAQMQRLESELGVTLFDRTGRTARLTLKGRQLVSQAQELLALYDTLGMRTGVNVVAKPVTIGAIASVQRSLLPDVLTRFFKQNPTGRVRVIPGLSMELVNMVDAGELDMAAVLCPPFPLQNGLQWTMLTHEPFRLVVPRHISGDNILALLAEHQFIRYDRASFGGRHVDRFLRDRNISVSEICEVDELEAIMRLVSNGVGVSLLPETATWRKWPAAVRAIDLGPLTFYRDVGLIHRHLSGLDEQVRQIAEMMCGNADAD